jgi:hypothetical protein
LSQNGRDRRKKPEHDPDPRGRHRGGGRASAGIWSWSRGARLGRRRGIRRWRIEPNWRLDRRPHPRVGFGHHRAPA